MVKTSLLNNIYLFIYCNLLLIFSLWKGAGGDYLRYIEVYDGILSGADRNFEILIHIIFKVFKNLSFDYVFLQSFLVMFPSVFFLYYYRKYSSLTFFSSFIYFFIVFGIGSPRQFISSIVIAFFIDNHHKLSRMKMLLISSLVLILIYSLHKGAALVFTIFLLCLFINYKHYLIVLGSLFLSLIFIINEHDFLTYVYRVYIYDGLYSSGFLFRSIPFFLLSFIMFRYRVINLFSLIAMLMFFSISIIFSLVGFNTLFDRYFLLFIPTLLLTFEKLKSALPKLSFVFISFVYSLYWISFLLGWYHFSTSAANWRSGELILYW
jgi:hypothetical protein